MLVSTSKRLSATILLSIVIACMNSNAKGDIVYDVATDFSLSNNPNGAWSYGTLDTPTGNFVPHDTASNSFLNNNFASWINSGTFPSVSLNTASTNQQGGGMNLDPGKLALHPGNSATLKSAVRWTAPSTNLFSINAVFEGRDNLTFATTDLYIVHNDTILANGAVNNSFGPGSGLTYSDEVLMNVGDTLNFVVGFGGDSHFGDSTGLAATITSVPEPSSATAIVMAIVGFAVRRRRSIAF